MGERYHFETRWTSDASPDEVWRVISREAQE
jgi:hypothetical protein